MTTNWTNKAATKWLLLALKVSNCMLEEPLFIYIFILVLLLMCRTIAEDGRLEKFNKSNLN